MLFFDFIQSINKKFNLCYDSEMKLICGEQIHMWYLVGVQVRLWHFCSVLKIRTIEYHKYGKRYVYEPIYLWK